MELLWASDAPQSVADVHARLSVERELAYTTVMTVLDRLSKKGLVDRVLVSRAWQYTARNPQAVVIAREMEALLVGVAPEVREAALNEFLSTLEPDELRLLVSVPSAE